MMHLSLTNKMHNDKARRVPESVKAYMVKRFLLLPEYIDMLRCFEYREAVGNSEVKRFSIFSPYKAKEHHISINTRADLLQHREVLEYEGLIDSQGTVYVADRREPSPRVKSLRNSFFWLSDSNAHDPSYTEPVDKVSKIKLKE